MKEPGTDTAWTAELHANQKLTISPRASRRLVRLIAYMLGAVMTGSSVALNASPSERGEWESVVFYVGLAGLLVFVPRGLWAAYGLVAGRPVLTIDLQGVELGRRRLGWSQMRRIVLRPESPALRYLAIGTPTVRLHGDDGSQHIDVKRDHVRDLESFADWLRHLQQRETNNHGPSRPTGLRERCCRRSGRAVRSGRRSRLPHLGHQSRGLTWVRRQWLPKGSRNATSMP